GHFTLKPATALDVRELKRRIDSESVEEDFTEIVFRFTQGARMSFLQGLKEKTATPAEADAAFKRWRERVRQRREFATSFSEQVLQGESMDNVDAEVLAAIYNRDHPLFLDSYIHGKKHKDLRFYVRAKVGALPQLDSPEEVALVNLNSEGM